MAKILQAVYTGLESLGWHEHVAWLRAPRRCLKPMMTTGFSVAGALYPNVFYPEVGLQFQTVLFSWFSVAGPTATALITLLYTWGVGTCGMFGSQLALKQWTKWRRRHYKTLVPLTKAQIQAIELKNITLKLTPEQIIALQQWFIRMHERMQVADSPYQIDLEAAYLEFQFGNLKPYFKLLRLLGQDPTLLQEHAQTALPFIPLSI